MLRVSLGRLAVASALISCSFMPRQSSADIAPLDQAAAGVTDCWEAYDSQRVGIMAPAEIQAFAASRSPDEKTAIADKVLEDAVKRCSVEKATLERETFAAYGDKRMAETYLQGFMANARFRINWHIQFLMQNRAQSLAK